MSAPPPPSSARPPSPRSPRPSNPGTGSPLPSSEPPTTGTGTGTPGSTVPRTPSTAQTPGIAGTAGTAGSDSLPLPVGMLAPPTQPRPNLSSLLFMSAFFFFMSGGNNQYPIRGTELNTEGELVWRKTELELAKEWRDEWRGWMGGNETEAGNWTAPAYPAIDPSQLTPAKYMHETDRPFFQNITGFYRSATAHPLDLLVPASASTSTFFSGVDIPPLDEVDPAFNETLALELRGEWDWLHTTEFEMNIKERQTWVDKDEDLKSTLPNTTAHGTSHRQHANWTDWTWLKGVLTLKTSADAEGGVRSVDYPFYGLHHRPDGRYGLYAQPDGVRNDIRNIAKLWPDHAQAVNDILLGELEEEYQRLEYNVLNPEMALDDESAPSRCPLLVSLRVPPLPYQLYPETVDLYESELEDDTGLWRSLRRPPEYFSSPGPGLGGVIVAEDCAFALGIDQGVGLRVGEYWRSSISYSALASASQLLVLLFLVRQMEATRTPSTLSKISLWTVVLMGIADSWIFSAHVVIGVMSDNRRTSLPMLVPGFLCACTAIIFGPRYAVAIHRVQAPESESRPAPTPIPAPAPAPAPAPGSSPNAAPNRAAGDDGGNLPTQALVDQRSLSERIRDVYAARPSILWITGLVFIFVAFQVALIPSVVPFFLFGMYSFWVPQIWRNATRGTIHAFDHRFIIGTSIGRLALPLYVFGYKDNVFFLTPSRWVFGLVIWQVVQIAMLFAQERFGPAFFLPKRLQPAESYNYHPLLPASDPENPESADFSSEKTCSICMEEVDTRPGPSASSEVLLGMHMRKSYALAPCHHLFHTKCLQQWLAIRTICPLCKRNLPPM